MKAAMRAKDAARLSAIRLLLAGIKQREVDERKELTDADVTSVLEKMIKQRRESIAQYEKAARQDLADAEKFELGVLSGYLPQQMSDAEVQQEVQKAISATDNMDVIAQYQILLQSRRPLTSDELEDVHRRLSFVKSKLVENIRAQAEVSP